MHVGTPELATRKPVMHPWFQVHYYLRLLVSKGKFDIAKNG